MLDAAHGETVGSVSGSHWVDKSRTVPAIAGVLIAGNVRRRAPHNALCADERQGSRRTVAVARSRR